jgi:hypothetical protein
MIPLFKIIAIVGKTFAKPFISQAKYMVKNGRFVPITRRFVWMGHKVHYFELVINKKFFGMKVNEERLKKLTDEEAIEYATSFILEIVVLYGVILGIAYVELNKAAESSAKEKEDKEKMKVAIKNLQQEMSDTKLILLQIKDSVPGLNITPAISNDETQSVKDLLQRVQTVEKVQQDSNHQMTKFIKEFTDRVTMRPNPSIQRLPTSD